MAATTGSLPPDIPRSGSFGISPTPVYTDESLKKQMDDLPSLYQKTAGVINGSLIGMLKAGPRAIVLILDETLRWGSEHLLKIPWLQYEWMRGKLEDEIKISDTLFTEWNNIFKSTPLLGFAVFWVFYLNSIGAKIFGGFMSIKAKSIQDANKSNPINLASPEQVLLAEIRGGIDVFESADLLGRLGIPPQVQSVIKTVMVQYTDAGTVIAALIKGEITGSEADKLLDAMNVDVTARKAIVGGIKQVAPLDVLIQNVYRGHLTRDNFNKELARQGYDEKEQTFFDNILDRIPPIQDLITMGVREAFSPEKVAEFQYDEDFPVDFGVWAEKQGFDKEWAKKYWYAHWQLPSPQMAFEMLHRGVIDAEVLDRFLIVADYPKFWRDKMKEISYHPLSRVDVRRMYQLGTFDRIEGMTPEQAVEKAYLDIGYSPFNAKLMLQFTIDFYGEERKKLTEAKVINLFKKGLIKEKETETLLKKLNYRDEYIVYIMESANYDIESDVLDSLMGKLRTLYLNGEITKPEVLTELSTETTIPVDTTALFKTWDFDREARRRLPRADDVMEWVTNGIITPKRGIEKLTFQGYSKEDAQAYVDNLTIPPKQGK